jgi:hypothetical protein
MVGVKPRPMVPNVVRVSAYRCCCPGGRCPLVLLLLLSAPLTPYWHIRWIGWCANTPSWDRSSSTSESAMCGCVRLWKPSPHTASPKMPSNLDRAQGAPPTAPMGLYEVWDTSHIEQTRSVGHLTPSPIDNTRISIQRAVGRPAPSWTTVGHTENSKHLGLLRGQAATVAHTADAPGLA